MLMFFWVLAPLDANGSENHTVSIFRAEDGDYGYPKRWHLPTSLHGAKTQKSIIMFGFLSLSKYYLLIRDPMFEN
jgi:hypothetical protein